MIIVLLFIIYTVNSNKAHVQQLPIISSKIPQKEDAILQSQLNKIRKNLPENYMPHSYPSIDNHFYRICNEIILKYLILLTVLCVLIICTYNFLIIFLVTSVFFIIYLIRDIFKKFSKQKIYLIIWQLFCMFGVFFTFISYIIVILNLVIIYNICKIFFLNRKNSLKNRKNEITF